MNRLHLSRRNILKLCLSVSGLLILDGLRKFLSYMEPEVIVSQMILNSPESYPAGSVTLVPAAQSYILRDAAGLYAVSAICSHLGCHVHHSNSQFECPCHGSRFAFDGSVAAGPAIRSLHHLQLSLSSELKLILDATTVVSPDQRLDPGSSA